MPRGSRVRRPPERYRNVTAIRERLQPTDGAVRDQPTRACAPRSATQSTSAGRAPVFPIRTPESQEGQASQMPTQEDDILENRLTGDTEAVDMVAYL